MKVFEGFKVEGDYYTKVIPMAETIQRDLNADCEYKRSPDPVCVEKNGSSFSVETGFRFWAKSRKPKTRFFTYFLHFFFY